MWMFLEPYSFIFEGKQGYIIYNTLNGEIVKSYNTKIINDIIRSIKQSNRYGISIEENLLKDKSVLHFIKDLRETFTGDIINIEEMGHAPFVFKPVLDLLNNPFRNEDIKENPFDKEEVVKYLHEVTLYLGGTCIHNCEQCINLYKQTTFCTNQTCDNVLTKTDYENLFIHLATIGLKNVKLIINDLGSSSTIEIISLMNLYELYPDVYINYMNFKIGSFNRLCSSVKINSLNILVNKQLNKNIKEIPQAANWIFLVDAEDTLLKVNSFIEAEGINAKIVPIYTKKNITFFENFVYTTFDDLKSQVLSKKEVFAKQILNETMFGKLYIMADGMVFANLNRKSLGNIKINSLNELIHKELLSKDSWLFTRNYGKCSNCVYKYLCPSPSNYELFMGNLDLCTIVD